MNGVYRSIQLTTKAKPTVYDRYPLDPNADGRGATLPVKVNDIPPVQGANDVAVQLEWLRAHAPPG
jgi:hypothetical protein